MSEEVRDPAIKLFGAKILLPDSQIPAADVTNPDSQIQLQEECGETPRARIKDTAILESIPPCEPSLNSTVFQKPVEDEQDNVSRKPNTLIPCPRCNSSATKFCYFNNYNVNQPRHFCKNCQRYWTAGGTMRNVPVGAGRRKNKHPTPPFCHQITPSSEDSCVGENGGEEPLGLEIESREQASCAGPTHGLQFYPGPLLPYAWNPNWGSPAMIAIPGFVPASCWDMTGKWNSSPTLGKHLRDSNVETEGKSEKLFWVPKTLRVDELDDAAKSSIWATLGIKADKNELELELKNGGIFKAFQPKKESSGSGSGDLASDEILKANPAALSRSNTFQESN